jgi:hypothetical protein
MVHRWSRGSVVSQLTLIATERSSQQTMCPELHAISKTTGSAWCTDAEISLEKSHLVPLLETLGVPPRRPCSLGMSLQQHEIGPEARRPRRPRNRVGQGARKVPRQFPLILRISNRSYFSVAPCLSPISATAGIARHRRAKPTPVVVERRQGASNSVATRSESHAIESYRRCIGASMRYEQDV